MLFKKLQNSVLILSQTISHLMSISTIDFAILLLLYSLGISLILSTELKAKESITFDDIIQTRWFSMSWKKHMKNVSDLRESNVKLDMDTDKRLEEILTDIKDSDNAVSLNFLKDYMRLRPDDDDAIQELRLKLAMKDDVQYRVIVDDNDQKIYLAFSSKEKSTE